MKNSNLRISINATFWNGITDIIVKSLTTGPLLTAYAISLGMGNILLGFLQSIVSFSNLLHIVVSYFLEKGKSPKNIAYISSFLSRPLLLLLAFSFFFRENPWGILIFVSSYILFYVLVSTTGGAFWPWCKAIIPQSLTVSFFAHRIRYILLVKILTVTTATTILSFINTNYPSKNSSIYSFLLFFAFIVGLFYTYTLSRMQSVKLQNNVGLHFFKKIQVILKNKKFLHLFLSIGFVNFTLSFFNAFSIVFLLKNLMLSVPMTICFSIGSSCVDILFIDLWKKYIYKNKLTRIISISSFLFIAAIMCLTCVSIYKIYIYPFLIIAFILIGIGNSGVNLVISDVSITYIPTRMSSVYISLMNIGRSSFSGIGSFLAGIIIETLGYYTVYNWTFFFIFCGIFFIFSGIFCGRVKPVEGND